MQCVAPIVVDKHGISGSIHCGRCIACRVNKTEEWAMRIIHESRLHSKTCFITLTYSNEFLPGDGSISVRPLQLFIKRLRKNSGLKNLRYFAVGEYGELENRPHYHAMLFGMNKADRYLIEKAWHLGFVHVGNLELKSARYVAKYVQKKITGELAEKHYAGRMPEFMLSSRRPGIGHDFAVQWLENWKEKGYIIENGIKKPMPNYYKAMLTPGERGRLRNKVYDYEKQKRKIAGVQSTEELVEFYEKPLRERAGRVINLEARLNLKKERRMLNV